LGEGTILFSVLLSLSACLLQLLGFEAVLKSLKVGLQVLVYGTHVGTVRYIGELDKQEKRTVVGIEFEKAGPYSPPVLSVAHAHSCAVGKCDGMWHHSRYFTCKPLHGDFVLPQFLQVRWHRCYGRSLADVLCRSLCQSRRQLWQGCPKKSRRPR
jgi:hypothetical protein